MAALPRSSGDFRKPSFWKEFYKDPTNAFEWYGDFNNFGHTLINYMKLNDRILQIGCGSSKLANQLYDNGYRTIDSVDTDQCVIERQIARNCSTRPELQFFCCSASEIDSPDEKYNVILDKGTLDALMPSEKENAVEEVEKMFVEVCRVLAVGGRYIVLTLAQRQVLTSYLLYFLGRRDFMIRIEKNNDADWKFPLPVFLLIATKLRVPLPSPYMELILSSDRKASKFSDPADLINAVNAEQEFSRFRHLCSNKLIEEVSMVLYGSDERPRYQVAVVDNPDVSELRSFAVFIIPVGRDHDWFFATEKGRLSLRKQCNKDRLAVVTLNRNQTYESMEHVKDELGPYVIQLTPATLLRAQDPSVVEFLSLGEVDVKKTRATGDSDINGPWAVEDVRIQNSIFRRLVFLSARNLVQSEVKISRNKKGWESIDLNVLTSDYHEAMLSALPFVLSAGEKLNQSTKLRLLVLGLGGGILPSFLHIKFPSAYIVAVELDPKVVEIARDFFAFNCDSRLNVVINDGLVYIEELLQRKDESLLFDVIFVDVAGSIHDDGLSCPSPPFVTEEALKNMHRALSEKGVLALNLVTRNDDVAEQVKGRILSVFSYFFVHRNVEDINQVLICPKVRKSKSDAQKVCEHYKEKGTLRNLFTNISSLEFCEKEEE